MLKGVEALLEDKSEHDRAVTMNYQHYLKTFEGNVVKTRLCEIINNADHLERFYSDPVEEDYRFKELGQ